MKQFNVRTFKEFDMEVYLEKLNEHGFFKFLIKHEDSMKKMIEYITKSKYFNHYNNNNTLEDQIIDERFFELKEKYQFNKQELLQILNKYV